MIKDFVKNYDKLDLGLEMSIDGLEIVSTNHMYYIFPSNRGNKLSTYKTRSNWLSSMYRLFDDVITRVSHDEYTYKSIKSFLDLVVNVDREETVLLAIVLRVTSDKVYYKNGKHKQYDTSNRIKSPEDCLVSSLSSIVDSKSYDDKYHTDIIINRKIVDSEDELGIDLGLYINNKSKCESRIVNLGRHKCRYDKDISSYVLEEEQELELSNVEKVR